MIVGDVSKLKIPEGKVRGLAQFNKITGALTGILSWVDPETLNNDYFKYREIEIDFMNETVVGTYDDFKIVANDSLPMEIPEEILDKSAQQRITKKYPVIQQVNILSRAIMKLSERLGVEQEELLEMVDYIDEIKRENRVRKEFYKNNPSYRYKSYEDLAKEQADQLEGGLHEFYGGRPVEGGRVF